jgi:8-oxo-dGTP pyrophosphatase MutT (NUDIX family)
VECQLLPGDQAHAGESGCDGLQREACFELAQGGADAEVDPPGEPIDAGPVETALREAAEETDLDPSGVDPSRRFPDCTSRLPAST